MLPDEKADLDQSRKREGASAWRIVSLCVSFATFRNGLAGALQAEFERVVGADERATLIAQQVERGALFNR